MITENLRLDKKLLNNVEIRECLNKIIESKSFDDKIIIRPSGTEDLIRVTVGMKNQNDIEKTLKNIKVVLQEEQMRRALILAAGKGTRMKTDIPKCGYPILKKAMILYQIEALERANVDQIIVVIGYKAKYFQELLGSRVIFVTQEEMLGTAHAALQAKSLLELKIGKTIIMPGDMPLIHAPLIDKLFRGHEEMGNDLTVVSMIQENPKGYGRIIYDEYGNINNIIEDRDCNDVQKKLMK